MGEGIPEFLKRHCEHPSPAISCVGCKRNPTFEDHNTKPVLISCASIKIVVMGDLKGTPAVHFNFPLQSYSLYTTFKSGIAASGEPIPLE